MPYDALTTRQARLEERARKTAHRRPSYRRTGLGVRIFTGLVSAALVLTGGIAVLEGWGTAAWAENLWVSLFFFVAAFLVSWFPWKRKLARDQEYAYAARELAHERATQLTLALQQHSDPEGPAPTVREIMTGMRWSEEAVVDGLAKAIKRGLIYEDFDNTLMRYTYRPTSALNAQLQAHKDFENRLTKPVATRAPWASQVHEDR